MPSWHETHVAIYKKVMKLKLKMEKKKTSDWMSQSQKTPINDCKMPQTKDKRYCIGISNKHFIPTPHQATHNQV